MPQPRSSLSVVNYITGISDGLLLPIIPCALLSLYFGEGLSEIFAWFAITACLGAFVYGFARYSGEKNEIEHNHPSIAKKESQKDAERLRHIGIDETLVNEMMQQVKKEQESWLKEIRENDMDWETLDLKRARRSGLQTGLGFLMGAFLIALPFLLLILNISGLTFFLLTEFLIMGLFGWLKGKYIQKNPFSLAVTQIILGFSVLIVLATAGYWILKNALYF
jgi:VIT1/CCC1 family predicted Fe2+/Mn2+ transporter